MKDMRRLGAKVPIVPGAEPAIAFMRPWYVTMNCTARSLASCHSLAPLDPIYRHTTILLLDRLLALSGWEEEARAQCSPDQYLR